MLRKTALVEGETYHVFNRGAHKGKIFSNDDDYGRFLLLLHLCNGSEPIVMRDLLARNKGRSSVELFKESTDKSLVDVLAYCLMPNHFHLVLRQKSKDGITKFMNRIGTAYSMYFNTKYQHSGVLFQGRFKSVHIDSEPYFRYIFSYVHLNPIELVEPLWKEQGIQDRSKIKSFISGYTNSSFLDYSNKVRPQKEILALHDAPEFLRSQNDLEDLLRWFTEAGPLQPVDSTPRAQ